MAAIFQEKKLFLILSKNFMFFEWKFEECDMRKGCKMRNLEFDVGVGESSFLEMEVSSERGHLFLRLYNPAFVSNGYYMIVISDSNESVIFNEFTSTKTFSNLSSVDLLGRFRELPSSTVFPLIISCTAKSLSTNISRISNQSLNRFSELSTDLKKMLDQSISHDIVLNVDGESIKSHKAILQARSPVFNKMLTYDSSEVAENTVVITGIGVSAMKKFLIFFYTGEMGKCDFDEALELYYVADNTARGSLREDFRIELLSNISVDNACSLFALANRHNDEVFLEQVVSFICDNFESVVSTDAVDELSKNDMKLLMRMCARALKK